jgi:hypothetical protein
MVLLPALFGPNNRVMGFRSILTLSRMPLKFSMVMLVMDMFISCEAFVEIVLLKSFIENIY